MDWEELFKDKLYIDMPSIDVKCGFHSTNNEPPIAYIESLSLGGDGWYVDDAAKVCEEIKEAIIEIIHKHRSGNNGND